MLAWLSGQRGLAEGGRATGRYASEQEWRGAAGKRKDGAAPAQLFVTDTLAALGAEVRAVHAALPSPAPALPFT